MLYYILQIIVCQVLFLLVYDLFLKNETFFNYNRVYLLITALLSFVLPFVKIDSLKALAPENFTINLHEIINQSPTVNKEFTTQLSNQQSVSIWSYILILGIVVMTIIFSYKLIKIINLKLKNPSYRLDNILVIKVLKSSTAFSFFNMVFIGEKISEQQQDTILKHELVHVKQYHTIDLLVFEIMQILLWFNPLVYMYQNRIKTLHEYIADETAINQNDKQSYYRELLNQVFETNSVSFTNSFFNKSLIKKRIIMLQKSKSKKVSMLKYALLIPMVFGMSFYVSCSGQEVSGNEINLSQYTYTMNIGEETQSSKEKAQRNKFEAFLYSNKNYVGWLHFDTKKQLAIHTVHKKSEKLPENYSEGKVTNAEGKSYLLYSSLGFDGFAA